MSSTSEPSRRQRIEALLEQEPEDPFLQYSLAMELRKEGRHEEALQWFDRLQRRQPPYVPAFFMAGQLLAQLGRTSQAQAVLEQGIREAQAQGDHHAAGEMQEFLQSLSQDFPDQEP